MRQGGECTFPTHTSRPTYTTYATSRRTADAATRGFKKVSFECIVHQASAAKPKKHTTFTGRAAVPAHPKRSSFTISAVTYLLLAGLGKSKDVKSNSFTKHETQPSLHEQTHTVCPHCVQTNQNSDRVNTLSPSPIQSIHKYLLFVRIWQQPGNKMSSSTHWDKNIVDQMNN